jgi:collagenase-like PrtC family protease
MLEHVPQLVAEGHDCFRIEAVSESPAYRLEVGRVYREALKQTVAGMNGIEEGWWTTLRSHARVGLCNGFYFGKSGMEYLGVRPEAVASAVRRPGADAI